MKKIGSGSYHIWSGELNEFVGFIAERGFYLGACNYKDQETEIVDRENRPKGRIRALTSGLAVLNEVAAEAKSGFEKATEDYIANSRVTV